MPALLPELLEAQATGRIAEIYDEIRRLSGVPYVSSLQRYVATLPGALEWAWDALRPAMLSGAIPQTGWRLARDGWGRGYATEAARASVAHGFTELGLEEIVAMVVPGNDRSQGVMRKLAMTRDEHADFDHPLVEEGSPVRRHRLYRLTRDQWAAAADADGVRQ